jgi:CRISPR-associated protein Cas2
MRWIIAYDISDPRRLNRTARCLQQHAQRVQKSVFIFEGDEAHLLCVLDHAAEHIDPRCDRLQAFPMASRRPTHDRGGPANLQPAASAVVAAPGMLLHVDPLVPSA